MKNFTIIRLGIICALIVVASAERRKTLRIRFGRSEAKRDNDLNYCDNCFLCYNPCDPYLLVKVDNIQQFRTATKWSEESPIFDQTYTSYLISKDAKITIEMWDDDAGEQPDDLMSRWEDLSISWLLENGELSDRNNKVRFTATYTDE